MKFLVLNPNATARITELIAEQARAVTTPKTTIVARNPAWGSPSIETHVDGHLAAIGMLEVIAHEGAHDGVLVAAFSDPGINAVREAVDVPVVGIGEAALAEAATFGPFAVLTVAQGSVGLVHELISRYGHVDACRGVYAAPVSVLDAADPEAVRGALVATAKQLVRETDVVAICIGGGPLGVHADAISAATGLPVVNAVHAGLRALHQRAEQQPHGNRSRTYGLIDHKQLIGNPAFLPALQGLLWPSDKPSTLRDWTCTDT